MGEGEGEQRFLPPEPSGPEPDLGGEPDREREAPQGPQQPPQGWQQPQGPQQQQPPQQPPPQAWQQQPQGWQQPPQGWQQPPQAWQQQQPPPGHAPWEQPPAAPRQPWAWQPGPAVPDNGAAVAGFSLSLTAGGLLVISVGLSSVVSIVCAGLGIFFSRRGRARVDRGETPKHRGLAQAGYVIGIVSVVLAVLATIGWILVISDGDFWDELDQQQQSDPNGTETSLAPALLRAGATTLRAAATLL